MGGWGSLFGTGSLYCNPKAMYASQAYASTCHLWPLDKHSVWSMKTKRLVLQMTCSKLEAGVKLCSSLYGLTALALVKGWEMSGNLWDSPQWTLEAGP